MSTKESGGGNVYFQNSKNAEINELKSDLNTMKVDSQKDAMKQIIASMTIGKDVSSLFPDVVKCMRTNNVELKKLIYLYIINYAKSKPDLTFLAINAFNIDAQDKTSPIIRALAVRTIGCIRVDKVISYLCDTLNTSLKDEDAYVRKTACICVAKLFNTNPQYVKENDFIQSLLNMLSDGNASVVANALASLNEISILCGENVLKVKSKILKRILSALAESNEWGQIYILDSLASYTPKNAKQSEEIIESVLPRLNHVNPAVVMSAVKVVLKFLDWVESVENVRTYGKKISNSLMTVMMAGPEIQYVLLRSLHAVIQKRPYLLDKDFKFFFVKYNDPIYVKLEKLDILFKLNDSKNFENIMAEMKNYAITEFDNELVKKSIQYIGCIGLKFEKSVDLCVEHINDVMEHNQDFTVNHAIIVARDILRKYKDKPKTRDLIPKINTDILGFITEAESKSAFLYILGEFCTKIDKSTQMIENFVEGFTQETFVSVRLQILTATIKNYVNKPDETESIIQTVLQKGGEESENPDVRDRAYLYWRLLETEPDIAKDMILGERPSFDYREDTPFESELVTNIIENMTNVSAVYHKNSSELMLKEDLILDENQKMEREKKPTPQKKESNKQNVSPTKEDKAPKEVKNQDLLGLDSNIPSESQKPNNNSNSKNINLMDDIFNLGSSSNNANNDDEFEFSGGNTGSESFTDESQTIKIFDNNSNGVTSQTPNLCVTPSVQGVNGNTGLAIYTTFARENSKMIFGLYIKNYSNTTISNIEIFLNNNSFGLAVTNQNLGNLTISGKSSQTIKLPCEILNEKNDKKQPISPFKIDVCLKSSLDVFFFSTPFLINILFSETGKMPNQNFVEFFKANSGNKANITYFADNINSTYTTDEGLNKFFEKNNIFQVAKNNKADPPLTYYSMSVANVISCILQVSFKPFTGINFKIISNVDQITPLVKEVLDYILL